MFTWEDHGALLGEIRSRAAAAEGSVCLIDVCEVPGNATTGAGVAQRTRMRAEGCLVKAYPSFACFECRVKPKAPSRAVSVSCADIHTGDASMRGW